MSKFEDFLKKILSVIFKETEYDKEKAEKSLEKIVEHQRQNKGAENDEHN